MMTSHVGHMDKRPQGPKVKEPLVIVKGLIEYLKMRFLSEYRPFGCSLAPTIRCNLRCPNCYEQLNRSHLGHGKEELSVQEMVYLADNLVQKGIHHCTITDGEPLIDRASLEKVEVIINRFWVNYLVTNGTMELPDLPLLFVISLDGPEKVHDSMRGGGVLSRIRKNIKSSPSDLVYGLCTLDTQNRPYIEETIMTAQDLGLRGLMFNWKNPLSEKDPTWVPFPERNKDIDEILGLKESYGDIVCNTRYELDHLRQPGWGRICPHELVLSYDAFGEQKRPCIFGEMADCSRCGCHVFPALLEAVKKGTPSIEFRLIFDFISRYWMNISPDRMMKLVKVQAGKG
jgi:MoaA/NifB/PqqE/SkfB family radical SAM enzyme